MLTSLGRLGVQSKDAAKNSDCMEISIVRGIESGMETVFVLSRITKFEDLVRFLCRPSTLVGSIAKIK